MKWESEGFLLSKRKFRENANIINVFTSKYGKMGGIVYGANSRKIRNYLQISNKIFTFYNSKSENKIGYFKTELIHPISPKYFNDKKRTSALLSLTSILDVLLPESQPYKELYRTLEEFINNLDSQKWPYLYLFWELLLIKELGFDQDLEKYNSDIHEKRIIDIKIDSIKYKVPYFIVNKSLPENIDSGLIRMGLNFTRSVLVNKFFLPNNLKFPRPRIMLENSFI